MPQPKKQRAILAHALGLNIGKIPKRTYRNYFCLSRGHQDEADVLRLIEFGLMIRVSSISVDEWVAAVTPAGRAEVDAPLEDIR